MFSPERYFSQLDEIVIFVYSAPVIFARPIPSITHKCTTQLGLEKYNSRKTRGIISTT
jgi:hypothetical protein